ncbi:hypothetical protein HID58_006449 [Brassica napus]|uniref:KIB1-4 beta-propeller domain-containing protein n=1 Tax=Brassica napus TaxID=3708 RepID=A0ABQ8EC43_BRANA|nr:hypothetical protein HID58_006449 [Brassica napus]
MVIITVLAMASPSPSSTTVASKRTKTKSEEEAMNTSILDLPSILLEVIMSRLVLKDNICASAVCNLFELRDPVRSKLYTLHLQKLAELAVCYIKDGWLLMYTSSSKDMFFFNPFSRELVSLPKFSLPFQAVAFSSPPTSDNCVLVALDFVTSVQERRIVISTCHPGATEHSKIVYLNEQFYCFTIGGGYLYSFHPSSRTWVCHQDAYVYHQLRGEWDKREIFSAERKGELFLMFACSKEKPLVFKLVSLQWEEVTSTKLDGFTTFFSSYNSELRRTTSASHGLVTSASVVFNPPNASLNWLELIPRHKSLWIVPPSNVFDYLTKSKSEEEAINTSILNLPSILLEVIMSRLVLKDNICASAVCNLFELRDPVRSKLFTLHLQELAELAVSKDMFFFNPFSRELVSLPKFSKRKKLIEWQRQIERLHIFAVAFSSPPTSDNCVLVALDFVTSVQERRIVISTCHPGATEWTTEAFPTQNCLLNEQFYCFTIGGGYLYSFHPSSRTWFRHQDAYVYHQLRGEWDKRETFLAERKGELFLMFACSKEKPLVFKLGSLQWEEVTSNELDGFTTFFSSYNSELRRTTSASHGLVTSASDVYNPPNASLNWLELIPCHKSLWIVPPSNIDK